MKQGKLFSKVSLIDLSIIVFLLLVLAVLVCRLALFPSANDTKDEEQKEFVAQDYEAVDCILSIKFQKVSSTLLSQPLQEGDRMLRGTYELGEITQVTREANTTTVGLTSGEAVTVERENAYNYCVEVPARLYRMDNALRLPDGTVVAVGQSMNFGTHYFYGKGLITGVEKIQ